MRWLNILLLLLVSCVKPAAKTTPPKFDVIYGQKGVYYFVKHGDTLDVLAHKFGVTTKDLLELNQLEQIHFVPNRRLFIPYKKYRENYFHIAHLLQGSLPKKLPELPNQSFIWPVNKFNISSHFGMRHGRPHSGIDLSAPRGTPIYAAAAGKVIFAKRFAGYGNIVVLQHSHYFTAYAHAQTLLVAVGQTVKQGQPIAKVGSTGRSSGSHLHFEILSGKEPTALDPLTLLPPRKDL